MHSLGFRASAIGSQKTILILLLGEAKVHNTVDDRNPALPLKDPKLWELWYIPG